MGRLVKKRRAELTPEQQAQYDRIAKTRTPDAEEQLGGPFDVWVRSPEFAQRMVSDGTFIWGRTTLHRGLVELAICVTGRFWESNVEWVAHAQMARDNGIDQAVLDDVFARRRPIATASADELLVYDVSVALHETHELPRPLFDRAVARFGERGLVEIIATIGFYTTVSMTLNAFNVDVGPGITPPFPKQD
jgi:4-carboxymuconolactone decarboxylase